MLRINPAVLSFVERLSYFSGSLNVIGSNFLGPQAVSFVERSTICTLRPYLRGCSIGGQL